MWATIIDACTMLIFETYFPYCYSCLSINPLCLNIDEYTIHISGYHQRHDAYTIHNISANCRDKIKETLDKETNFTGKT